MSEPESEPTKPEQTDGPPSLFVMETAVALVLVAFGALVAWDSYRLGSGWSALTGPRAGYFPFRLGLLLAFCGACVLGQAIWKRHSLTTRFIEPRQIRPVLTVALPSAVYVLAVQWLGIYVPSIVFVALFMGLVGKLRWWKCVLVGVGHVLLMFWLFEKRFMVPLPKGPIEEWFGL